MTTTQPVGKVYVSGQNLSDIRILDSETLDEVDRIPTETNMNVQLVISDYLEEEEMNLVAFSEVDSSDQSHVFIHNSITNERLSQIVNVPGLNGLEILSSSSLSSTPIIVSAGGSRLCVYNSLTTEKLIDCQNLPFDYICRIKCFPEWNLNEVFIGGRKGPNGLLHRYDLNQDCVMLGSYVGHVGSSRSYLNGITASLTDGILISGSSDDFSKGTLKLWSKDTFECIESVNLDNSCFSLDYSSNSHLICCGTYKEIEIYDIRNMRNRLRKVENVGFGFVFDLDSISNSPLFVSGCYDGSVSIWNPLTGKVLRKTKVGGNIRGIRFLPSFNTQQIEMRRIEQEREERQRIRIEEEQRVEALRLAQERQQQRRERRRRAAERKAEEERIRQEELKKERERIRREKREAEERERQQRQIEEIRSWRIDPSHIVLVQDIPLGHGAYGVVYKGEYRFNDMFSLPIAVKSIQCSPRCPREDVIREVKFLSRLRHESIVRCYGCYFNGSTAMVVFELCSGGDSFAWMSQHPQRLNVTFRVNVLHQIASALLYLHEEVNIAHHDMKPGNVLVSDNGVMKVCDFGLSKNLDSATSVGVSGTPIYLPNPAYAGQSGVRVKQDVYSFAITVWELWTGTLAFQSIRSQSFSNPYQMIMAIHFQQLRPLIPPDMPTALGQLLGRCWVDRPEDRPMMREVVTILGRIANGEEEIDVNASIVSTYVGVMSSTVPLPRQQHGSIVTSSTAGSSSSFVGGSTSIPSVPQHQGSIAQGNSRGGMTFTTTSRPSSHDSSPSFQSASPGSSYSSTSRGQQQQQQQTFQQGGGVGSTFTSSPSTSRMSSGTFNTRHTTTTTTPNIPSIGDFLQSIRLSNPQRVLTEINELGIEDMPDLVDLIPDEESLNGVFGFLGKKARMVKKKFVRETKKWLMANGFFDVE